LGPGIAEQEVLVLEAFEARLAQKRSELTYGMPN
jgi:hypothetical protein